MTERSFSGAIIPSRPDYTTRGAEASTDVGRARLILDALYAEGFDLVHSPALGFSLWNEVEGIWSHDAEHELRRRVQKLGQQLREASVEVFARAAEEDDDDKREQTQAKASRLLGLAAKCERTGLIENTVRELATLVERVEPDDFDADPDLLAVDNGTLNLRTGELGDGNRFDLCSQRLGVPFTSDATAPLWDATLREILVGEDGRTPDEELIGYFQRLMGYALTGHTSEQMLSVWHGDGANGKGVLMDTLEEVLGAITRTASFETFGVSRRDGGAASPDLARLAGARLVFASEGDDGLHLAEGLVKRLTGQEKITARKLQRDLFEYRPRFLLVLVSNHLPTVRGQDEGVWRRIKVLPFRRYFAPNDRDRDLREKLAVEREGILAWAVAGARAWYAADKRLGEPPSVEKVTASYRADSNRVRDFLLEAVRVTGDDGDSITGSELRRIYGDWCKAQGERPFGRNSFFEKVAKGPGLIREGGEGRATRFVGVRELTQAEQLGVSAGAPLGAVPAQRRKDAQEKK